MATVTELKEERSALVAKLRELDVQLASCEVLPGAADVYAPLRGYDHAAADRVVEKWRAILDAEPYDPEVWEALERNIGIYDYLHPEAGE